MELDNIVYIIYGDNLTRIFDAYPDYPKYAITGVDLGTLSSMFDMMVDKIKSHQDNPDHPLILMTNFYYLIEYCKIYCDQYKIELKFINSNNFSKVYDTMWEVNAYIDEQIDKIELKYGLNQ